jgi:phosphoribosylaminoimidazolecarboxamide formyltransferase/IMP cyclohydrolase
VATFGEVNATAGETRLGWMLTSAYVRARDADPRSSFGDVVAVSNPVTDDLAEFFTRTITDAIVAPGYEAGTVARLARKLGGRFLMLDVDPEVAIPPRERRDLFGMTFEQDRDTSPIDARLLTGADGLRGGRLTMLLALITLRYSQSNSIAVVRDGMTLGIRAGQQNRVDCVRLAVAKARLWWLRRHPYVRQLPAVTGIRDRLIWQVRFADDAMIVPQRTVFGDLCGDAARLLDERSWRESVGCAADRSDAGLGRVPTVSDSRASH